MSQVSRRPKVGNTKLRSLNTRQSSGTAAGTFAVSAGPYRNYHAEAGTKNEPWQVFGTSSKKELEYRSSRFEPENSLLSFSRGSGPPFKWQVSAAEYSLFYRALLQMRTTILRRLLIVATTYTHFCSQTHVSFLNYVCVFTHMCVFSHMYIPSEHECHHRTVFGWGLPIMQQNLLEFPSGKN